MALFSDYVRKTVPFLGGTVALDIRALSVTEAPEFVAQVKEIQTRWAESSERLPDEPDDKYEARLSAAFRDQERFVLEVLGRTIQTKAGTKGYYVRLPEPLVNEEDDSRIEDCRALGVRGGRVFRLAVLSEISSLAEVDPFLGNSSGSPSTSTTAAGLPTSSSPVSSTPTCETPSTATATPLVLASSSPAA